MGEASTFDIPRVSLEELSKTWKVRYDEDGKPLEKFAVVDKSRYYKLQKQLAKVGRELLEDFRLWQITELGVTDANARRALSVAWVALYTTGGKPVERLYDEEVSWYAKAALQSALRRLTTWILSDDDASFEDRSWARQVISEMTLLPPGTIPPPRDPKKVKPKKPPKKRFMLSDDDLLVLNEVIDRRHKREGYKRPWARLVCRLLLHTAASKAEIVNLEKEQVVKALAEYDADPRRGAISLWRRRARARVIPVTLIEGELRDLAAWPIPWGTVADIIAPTVDVDRRTTTATSRFAREWHSVCKEVGMSWSGAKLMHGLREALTIRVFKQTRDLVLVQQLFGEELNTRSLSKLKKNPRIQEILNESSGD